MELRKIRLKDIKPSEYNPRVISKEAFENLKNNIKEFGFLDPLVLNKSLTIISGHQRFKALNELGFVETEAIILDLDKTKEKILNISLNKISGEFDYDKLDKILNSIKKDEVTLTGFTNQEIRELTKKFDFSKELKEFNKLEKEETKHKIWTAKIKEGNDLNNVNKVLARIKKTKGWSRFSNDYCNGLLLKELCRKYSS